jgi:PAS domain S-box-containing protein
LRKIIGPRLGHTRLYISNFRILFIISVKASNIPAKKAGKQDWRCHTFSVIKEYTHNIMQTQKIIEQLGYNAKEAKIYLAVLSLGECRISDIAEKVKLPRTSVQIVAHKLHKDGLLNFYVMRRYKYWVAENPERLLDNLLRKKEILQEVLPRLAAIKKESWGKRQSLHYSHSLGLFRMLADSSFQPVLIANESVQIEYVNSAWEKQFGYSLEEIQGENPRMFKSGKTPDAVYKRMWEALKAEKMFQSDEIIDKRKNTTFFNLLTTIFALKHNGVTFYIQILDDITERKRVEELKQKFFQAID